MNKKRFILTVGVIIICVLLSTALGCTEKQADVTSEGPKVSQSLPKISTSEIPKVSQSLPTTTATTVGEDNPKMNNCRLIVRGKDITNKAYVHIDVETDELALPITLIMKELGAEVEWKDETTVVITTGDYTEVLDISDSAFGIPLPPGSLLFVREVIDGEVIMDICSCRYMIYWMNCGYSYDLDNMVIEVYDK